MSRIKVTAKVNTYDDPRKTDARVDSHWNDKNKIIITIHEESRTFNGEELKMAIDNCMNVQ